jgi:hypothetical protein
MTKATAVDGTALGHWVELQLPEPPWTELEPFVGFVYLDAQAGLSAKGGRAGDPAHAAQPSLTVRLPIGVPARVLTGDEAAARGLPVAPGWLAGFGPQPATDAPWRVDPALRGRFHPQWPDDLQVLLHDGESRRTGKRTELCWLRVDAVEDSEARRYAGTLMHPTHQLATVKLGDHVAFLAAPGGKHALMVTAAYVAERADWTIEPCPSCGLREGLDPPSVMARTRFPDAGDAVPEMFSAHCAMCGPPHAQMLARRRV